MDIELNLTEEHCTAPEPAPSSLTGLSQVDTVGSDDVLHAFSPYSLNRRPRIGLGGDAPAAGDRIHRRGYRRERVSPPGDGAATQPGRGAVGCLHAGSGRI